MSATSMMADDLGGYDSLGIPANIAAERAVLGALLADSEHHTAMVEVQSVLRPEHLLDQRHQAIYRTVLALYEQGAPTDPVAVLDALDRSGNLARVGGGPYLHDLYAAGVAVTSPGYHARIVADAAARRRVLEIGTRLQQAAQQAHQDDIGGLLDMARTQLDAAAEADRQDMAPDLDDALNETLDHLDAVWSGEIEPGLPSGLHDLDALTGGARPGQMITIAARPGVGKSTLGLDWARHVAIRRNRGVLVFSLEMSRHELVTRLLAAEAGVRLAALTRVGGPDPEDRRRLIAARERIRHAPLFLDDAPIASFSDIRSRARVRDAAMRRQSRARGDEEQGLGMIVVDYMQLMTSGKRAESRQVEVAEFSRNLKLLAKELEIPVITISQLNRGPEQRQDRRPQLADLRESGAIEQDSDMVILISRPDADADYKPEEDPNGDRSGEADFIVAKNRGNPTGTVTVLHQLHYSRFTSKAT